MPDKTQVIQAMERIISDVQGECEALILSYRGAEDPIDLRHKLNVHIDQLSNFEARLETIKKNHKRSLPRIRQT